MPKMTRLSDQMTMVAEEIEKSDELIAEAHLQLVIDTLTMRHQTSNKPLR